MLNRREKVVRMMENTNRVKIHEFAFGRMIDVVPYEFVEACVI